MSAKGLGFVESLKLNSSVEVSIQNFIDVKSTAPAALSERGK
jgi:hypothetical protein